MSQNKLKIVIAGATGYVGLDLVYFLSNHPKVNILHLCAQKNLGKDIQKFDKKIKGSLPKISNIKKPNKFKKPIAKAKYSNMRIDPKANNFTLSTISCRSSSQNDISLSTFVLSLSIIKLFLSF